MIEKIHQYFDHNVSHDLADIVRSHRFGVTTARQLRLEGASDAKQFLTAFERGWVMVSHNKSHYEELHDAWHRWGRFWDVHQPHHGVILLPSRPLPFVRDLLLALLAEETVFTGKLFVWHGSTGWRALTYRP